MIYRLNLLIIYINNYYILVKLLFNFKLSKLVYTYPPFIKVYKKHIYNKFIKKNDFHKIILQNAVMVILKNNKNKILFLNEYRPGLNKQTFGFPGGHIEKNETPLRSAKRELAEETGYIAKNWKILFTSTRHGSYNCGDDFIFTAELKKKNIKLRKELIKEKWLSVNEIHKLIKKNKFKTLGIIASILFYFYNEKFKNSI